MNRPSVTSRLIASVLLCVGLASSALLAQDQATDRPFLNPLFTDHVVLQRDMPASIWGWTQAGKEVKV